ncbi:hypothetical protein CJD36_022435 [Flavipsychrobacter stenotrophus]|uniref:Secretion system C-terminal sorting domain-containing protein n=1 Tax=Flavipsychrobacter stenotrophus TaxID=2077091 RepID=A0A2S7SPY7_9BACT|nr:T9SS type A sorting domain-containing protein [Flavipsychrobacter stenotrophus]PQJ08814.1 hypothetical protein CJD36_022435 [Flavipsychrobacter stenotrophus]
MKLFIASITVFILLSTVAVSNAQIKILFDASKAEMAGNADWVIDADQYNIKFSSSTGLPYLASGSNKSNPAQIPTPSQSGISATTAETYWTGAISAWAVDCVKKGYTVESLPWDGRITYGDASNTQDLSNYKVFIADEPNIPFSTTEKTALIMFVQAGGSLFMISDHNISDRNGDGWDSPRIWNDLIANNTIQPYPFGIYFDTTDFSQTTTNISASASDSIIHGPMGSVTEVQWSGGTTMTLNLAQNPSVKGVVFKTGTTPGNTNAMVAYARFGQGKVAAIGDSSPTDDGTGNPNSTLYPGYFGDAAGNHQLLLMKITIWLAGIPSLSIVSAIDHRQPTIKILPNPSHGIIHLSSDTQLFDIHFSVYNSAGQIVSTKIIDTIVGVTDLDVSLPTGFYIYKFENSLTSITGRFLVD